MCSKTRFPRTGGSSGEAEKAGGGVNRLLLKTLGGATGHRVEREPAEELEKMVAVAYLLNIQILGPVAPLTGQYSRGGLN